MPAIRQYTAGSIAGSQGLNPSDRTASAFSNAALATAEGGARQEQMARASGGAIADLGRSVGDVVTTAGQTAEDYYSKKEVLKFGADSAQLFADLTSKWNTTRNTSDPNDPTVAQRFNDEVLEPTLEQFGKNYITPTGQRMAVQKRQELLEHFAVQQGADQRIADANAAEQNLVTLQNTNAAALANDPSGLEFANRNVEQTIDGYKQVAGLSAEQNAHLDGLKQTMLRTNTIAAFHGMANTNPAAAVQALDKGFGRENLTEADQAAARAFAAQQQRRLDAQQKAGEVEQRRQNKAKVDQALGDLTADAIRNDGSLAITPDYFKGLKEIGSMPDAEPGAVRAAFDWARSELNRTEGKEMPVSDPATSEDFQKRMVLAPDDPKALSAEEVFTARAQGRLSSQEFSFYQDAVRSLSKDPAKRDAYAQFNKFLQFYKSSITQSNALMGKSFPQQDQRYNQFQFDMRQQFDAAYKAGTWKDVLTAGSANFLGKQIGPYQIGSKQSIAVYKQNIKEGVGAPVAVDNAKARKPGETIQQYNARMGGG